MPVSRAADEETDTETARRRLDVRHRDPMGQTRRVPQHSGPREAENGFVEQLESFRLELRVTVPVALPPGRATLETIPFWTGSSPTAQKTMGTVLVARLAARAAPELTARIMSNRL